MFVAIAPPISEENVAAMPPARANLHRCQLPNIWLSALCSSQLQSLTLLLRIRSEEDDQSDSRWDAPSRALTDQN
jgi:hypothetical protein